MNLSDDEISNKDKQNLLSLLRKHSDAFCKHKRDKGRTHLVEMTIDTGNVPPVRSGFRRLSPPQCEIVQKQVKELLEDGLIEPSTSEYSSPIVLAKKKSGDIRFACDFRQVNRLLIKMHIRLRESMMHVILCRTQSGSQFVI